MKKLFAILLFGLLFTASPAFATIYYVDFDGGDNTAAGTAEGTAWKDLPGTRQAADATAFLAGATGWASIVAGDTIRIKPGTTHDSTDGGQIDITTTHYSNAATAANPITITAYQEWTGASGAVTIDGTGITLDAQGFGIVHVAANIGGIKLDGAVAGGIIIRDSVYEGMVYNDTSGAQVDGAIVQYVNFINNGTGYDSVDGNQAQLAIYNHSNVNVNNCNFDGNSVRWINGVRFGTGTNGCGSSGTVTSCNAYNHYGTNSTGIGYLAHNSNITYTACTAYGNQKGWDCGESSTAYNIVYKIVNSTARDNQFGINFNGAAEASAYSIKFYVINSLVYDNSFQGSNIYSSPFELYVIHSVYARNGTDVAVGKYQGHINITPNTASDSQPITAVLRNNVFWKASGHASLITKYWSDTGGTNFTLNSNYNAWVQDTASHTYGNYFARWAFYTSGENSDFAFGTNGPGQASGNWYTWQGNGNGEPASSGTGHYHCDANSVTSFTAFTDPDNNSYSLTASVPGVNISGESWYTSEMGTDRDGVARTNWDLGAYEYGGADATDPLPSSPLPAGSQICSGANIADITMSVNCFDAVGCTACKAHATNVDIDSMSITLVQSGSTWSYTNEDQACGASYTFYAKCEDAADNESDAITINYSIAAWIPTGGTWAKRIQVGLKQLVVGGKPLEVQP